MANTKYESLNKVQKGRTDWMIKVRVIRQWRGKSNTGQPFKGYNLLLLDSKNVRMQAFVPGFLTDKMEKMFAVEKMYAIANFQVKDYTDQDKWRSITMDRQIQMTKDTQALEIKENQYFIANNSFDFFELADLRDLANQTTYLADVVGVVIKRNAIRTVHNRNGQDQLQVRLRITDGRDTINVVFWDQMAEDFEEEANTKEFEQPLILIIASGKVGLWKDQVDICNFSPTAYYINYNHHSVLQLRKMTAESNFTQDTPSMTQRKTNFKLYTVDEIKNFKQEYIQEEVICQVQIKKVEETDCWYYTQCTTCYKQIEAVDGSYICNNCSRVVPSPDKKFGICILAGDITGDIQIILNDRPIRTIFGKSVFDLDEGDGKFPFILQNLEGGDYTIKLIIAEFNIDKTHEMYVATDIFPGFNFQQQMVEEFSKQQTTEISMGETSGTSIHLDNIPEIK